MNYRALVVGLGQIGMGYDLSTNPKIRIATLARAFSEHSRFELVGGVDLDSTRRKLFQDQYTKPSFSKIEKAIEETRPNVVAIAVPTEAHYSMLPDYVWVRMKNIKKTMQRLGHLSLISMEKPILLSLIMEIWLFLEVMK